MEKAEEHQFEMHLAFVNYEKSFDSLKHDFLIKTISDQGITGKLISAIKDMYSSLKARMVTERPERYFAVDREVKQGDPLSLILFSVALEEVVRKMDWETKGLLVNERRLSNLRFADDIALLAGSGDELKDMLEELSERGEEAGLKIKIEKTKILSNKREDPVAIKWGGKIERVMMIRLSVLRPV